MKKVIQEEGARPVKIWTDDIEDEALQQAKSLARLPFIAGNGVALMPDVHAGKDDAVLDEIPGAYKSIDQVMADQTDLVEVVHVLKQVLCVKGA